MLRVQGTDRIQKISGRKSNGSVEIISDLICPRKHMINDQGWEVIRSANKIFAFVSSPKIYRQSEMVKRVQAWCHPFRCPDRNIPKNVPSILLPESDFIDSSLIVNKHKRKIQYDYFYFTVNARPGVENKGLYTFIAILPELCRHGLRGLVVVYYPNVSRIKRLTVHLTREQRRTLKSYDRFLTYHWGLLGDKQMDEKMKKCRFGLFPNTADNSPRIITECLSRDVPVLINDKIHGGWHYVNKKTGSLFNVKNISSKIEFMLNRKFNVRNNYESNFGFDISSRRLAEFLNPIFDYDYTNIYFSAFEKRLRNIG